MKRTIIAFAFIAIAALVVAISGCTTPTPTAAPTAAPTATPTATGVPAVVAVLSINGTVANETSFTLAELKAMPQIPVNVSTTNKANVTNTVTGSGVLISTLLAKASPASNATNITFIGSDGYAKIANLSVVTGSPNATVVISDDVILRDVVPGLQFGSWVGNLTVIKIS